MANAYRLSRHRPSSGAVKKPCLLLTNARCLGWGTLVPALLMVCASRFLGARADSISTVPGSHCCIVTMAVSKPVSRFFRLRNAVTPRFKDGLNKSLGLGPSAGSSQPQRLKAAYLVGASGTAEAVPFHNRARADLNQSFPKRPKKGAAGGFLVESLGSHPFGRERGKEWGTLSFVRRSERKAGPL